MAISRVAVKPGVTFRFPVPAGPFRTAAWQALLILFTLGVLGPGRVPAAEAEAPLRIAVAANFQPTLERLGVAFAQQGGPPLSLSSGATGLLYSQIVQGAPFELFFAADAARPEQLEKEGLVAPGTRRTYAVGRLVAWRPGTSWRGTLQEALRDDGLRVVAIANPATAPYGLAAQQALTRLGFDRDPPFKLVRGESIGQTFQFVATGNAQLGFIALSQVREAEPAQRARIEAESVTVPETMHEPIRQDVVLLRGARGRASARRFLAFVAGPQGRAILVEAGYTVP